MSADVEEIKRLSVLLDELLDLAPTDRERWLSALSGDAARSVPRLRSLLAWQASDPTAATLDRAPVFDILDSADEADFAVGQHVGPYRLLREIGRGGMGEVWLAERVDGQLKRSVALKLPMLGARRRLLVQRFARERDIVGALVHPNIARLYDAGLAEDGQPFLALEYVEGRTITAYCDERSLDAKARVELLRQVMEAVQYAHANLVVHRDLKPGNVLVTTQGRAMLLDFGIAKLIQEDRGEVDETELTRLGGRALTLQYAAPEQLNGSPVSIATDIWALGVLLYEMLTGRRPFEAPTRGAQEQAVLSGEPVRPSQHRSGAIGGLSRGHSADLDTVVLKALKKSPGERYATADAMSEDLARWLDGRPVRAQRASAWYRVRKTIGRNRLASAATLSVVLALLVGAGVAGWQARLARQSAELASRESERAQRERDAATAVRDFLIGVFRTSDPETAAYSAQQTRSVRDVLTDGIERLHASMDDQPESKSALYEALTGILTNLYEADRALALAREHVAFVERRLGVRHERYAVALLREAEARQSAGDDDGARILLTRAEAVLDGLGDHDSATRARLMIFKGAWYAATDRKGHDGLDQARSGVELLAARGAPPGERVQALIEIAARRAALGQLQRALEELDAAVALSHDFEGAALMRARGLAMRSGTQVALDRLADAVASQRAAVQAAQELPVDHPETARQILYLGSLLHAYVDRKEGRTRLADGLSRAERALPAASPALHNARLMNFNAMQLDGDQAAAAVLVPPLAAALADGTGPPGLRRDIGLSLARHFSLAGEPRRAAQALDLVVPLLAALPPMLTPAVLLAQARLSLARGDTAQSAALLARVAQMEAQLSASDEGTRQSWGDLRREALRQRVLLDSALAERTARPAEAIEAARKALSMALDHPSGWYPLTDVAEARLRLGSALAAAGDSLQARPYLAQAERFYALNHAPASPWLRQSRALLAHIDAGTTRALRDALKTGPVI